MWSKFMLYTDIIIYILHVQVIKLLLHRKILNTSRDELKRNDLSLVNIVISNPKLLMFMSLALRKNNIEIVTVILMSYG